MSNFKDFFDSKKSGNTALISKAESKIAIAAKINNLLIANPVIGSFSNSGKKEIAVEEFSNEVSQMVNSDKFLDEFSKDVGMPKVDESEDEFVNRAKDVMRNLLRAKLSK